MISGIVYFSKIILESLRNECETTPWSTNLYASPGLNELTSSSM